MKISHKLALIVLFGILIPSIITTYINYNSSVKIITSILQNNLQNGVKQRMNYAQNYSEHLIHALEVMSQSKLFMKAYKEGSEEKIHSILELNAKVHSFYDMFLIQKDGRIAVTLKRESDLHKNLFELPLKNSKFSEAYSELLESKKATIATFSYYEPSKKYAAFLLVPIVKDGEVLGAVGAQLDIDIFVKLSSDYSGLGESGEIVFAEKVAQKALFINRLRHDKEAIFKRSVLLGSTNGLAIQKAVNGESGHGIQRDYRGVEVIASWGYIEAFKIGMVIKIDTSEAYAKIAYLKRSMFIMALIIFLVTLYLVWYMQLMVGRLELKRIQYEYAISGTNDGLWDWDLLRDTIYFSPQVKHMLGYEDDEFENSLEQWEQVVHPDDLEKTLSFIESCHLNHKKEYKTEYRVRHKDGSWVWILDRGQTIFKDGKPVRMIGFHTDVTEHYNDKKAIEEKEEIMIAQSRHAAMGEMISMIAHQWRQPISVISMDANNILVDIELDSIEIESLKSDVEDIIMQTKYLSQTIDDFRDFFKPSKVKDEVFISDVFEEALSVINKSLENNNIELYSDFSNSTKVTIFSRELLQVFINILKNAKEALMDNREESRKIFNRIYETPNSIVVEICDNAGGIKESIVSKIFEPYFTTKEAKNGTGLGLYMSKTIVEKHLKGTIKAFNRDDGSCFEIVILKKQLDNE